MILALLAEMLEMLPYSNDYYCDDDTVTYEYENSDSITTDIISVCKHHSDFDDDDVKQQNWYAAKVIFVYDESSNRYITDRIVFENTDGDFAVCYIKADVIDEISMLRYSNIYYDMCEELVSNATKELC